MLLQPTENTKPSARATSWISTAVAAGIGAVGVAFALAAFALHTRHLVLSSRTLFAIIGLLLLLAATVTTLAKRVAHVGAELTTPESAQHDEIDEAKGLTRRVRLLRGNDDL